MIEKIILTASHHLAVSKIMNIYLKVGDPKWTDEIHTWIQTWYDMEHKEFVDYADKTINILEKQLQYVRKKLFMLVSDRDIELIENDLSEIRKRGSM